MINEKEKSIKPWNVEIQMNPTGELVIFIYLKKESIREGLVLESNSFFAERILFEGNLG